MQNSLTASFYRPVGNSTNVCLFYAVYESDRDVCAFALFSLLYFCLISLQRTTYLLTYYCKLRVLLVDYTILAHV